MERYLIETPHTAENCLALIDQINAQGYLSHFDWGCMNGVHTGWAVIEADSESEARLAVPPLVRGQARVVKVTKFDDATLAQVHKDELDRGQPLHQAIPLTPARAGSECYQRYRDEEEQCQHSL